MFFQELMPFFRAFFEDLGFTVVYSPKTNKKVINQGTEAMAAEPCYPVKVAHGHILALLKAGVKRIFLPCLIDVPPATPRSRPRRGLPHGPVPDATPCRPPLILPTTAPRCCAPVLHFGRGDRPTASGPAGSGERTGGRLLPGEPGHAPGPGGPAGLL